MANKTKTRLKVDLGKLDFSHLIKGSFPKLIITRSDITGMGVFAGQNIKKGSLVCPIVGVIFNASIGKGDYQQYCYFISDKFLIEPINEPNYFNHSCYPNVFINKNWVFEAIRDIKKGEEILVDYGTVDYFNYWFQCKCGSENCKGFVDGYYSRNKNYQKERGRYFSPYLKNKFKLK